MIEFDSSLILESRQAKIVESARSLLRDCERDRIRRRDHFTGNRPSMTLPTSARRVGEYPT